jgi:D-inositol-3-phosphate glycosyltransferase
VVASRVGGLEATIHDGVTGLLVPEGDPGALAAVIAGLLPDEPRRRALGRAAVAWACQFAWPEVARAVLDVYAEVAPALARLAPGRRDGRAAARPLPAACAVR